MQLAKRIPEPWGSFLEELDQRASGETRLDCLGGFVVTQLYGFSRETSDLDVLVVAPGKERTPLLESKAESFTGNTRVYLDSVGVAKVPEDYEERRTEMFRGA